MTLTALAQKVMEHGGHYDITGDETVSLAEAYLALQRENAALREALLELRGAMSAEPVLPFDEWMVSRIDAALTPSAAPGEGETR